VGDLTLRAGQPVLAELDGAAAGGRGGDRPLRDRRTLACPGDRPTNT
jgi:hypothetical protein